jgi:hypothetical protein
LPSDATSVKLYREGSRRWGDDTTLVAQNPSLRVRDWGQRGEYVIPAESGSVPTLTARHNLLGPTSAFHSTDKYGDACATSTTSTTSMYGFFNNS